MGGMPRIIVCQMIHRHDMTAAELVACAWFHADAMADGSNLGDILRDLATRFSAQADALRIRLAPERVRSLRRWSAALGEMGSRSDRQDAFALTVLLNMHDALLALDGAK